MAIVEVASQQTNMFSDFRKCLLCILYVISFADCKFIDDDPVYTSTDPAVREPRPCEVCKYLVTELGTRLEKSGRSKEVLQIGQQFDSKKKKVSYRTSELRLTEALHEPHICENILKYNVHAERKGSLRYAKGQSETMSTLHGLVNKGVEVKMDIPYDLWDQPSAEVTKMHRACFNLVEQYEEDIEEWYYNHQDEDMGDYLCRRRHLKHKNADPCGKIGEGNLDIHIIISACLDENPEIADKSDDEKPKKKKSKKTKKGKKNMKGDRGEKDEL